MIIISKYGIKIKNIEASTLFEYNIGVRDHFEYKEAIFTNSLFKDFLVENGLNVWKEESTRDIICLEFNFGSRSYYGEMAHLNKISNKSVYEYKRAKVLNDEFLLKKAEKKKTKIKELVETAYKNKNVYKELTVDELRKLYYNNGVDITYITYGKNGIEKKRETIHYNMLFRSPGKAKKGSCIFICDRLYDIAKKFLYMGYTLPDKNAPIVEISAYISLVASGIENKIKINPKNILILKDVDRFFNTNIIEITTNDQRQCVAEKIDNYSLKNTLFDGQALIDSSIFPSWGNGYILLRHHFCKVAAFNTNIQKFFRDYFGDKYLTAKVVDMFGNEHYVKDIEMITTDNAMKWLKLNISYEYWCDRIFENNCMFGIVKTAHKSKLGNMQKMSYQMINSLQTSIMDGVVKNSVDFIHRLKQDNTEFLKYLKDNSNYSNDYEALIFLYEHNPEFYRSEYFRTRKKQIIYAYTLNVKSGKVINNADNLVIVGSPYAMLLYGATGDESVVDKDNTFIYEKGTIQCYTKRFSNGEYLAGFRSPFNGKYNLTYLHNVYNELFDKYFNFTEQIIAVNMIGTDFQDRNNGSDQDSDFLYTTNQTDISLYAKYCYSNYPTIVNNIPKDKNIYNNTMDDFARIDSALAASQTDIGESSNLAQLAQTYTCNFKNDKYEKYICILSVLAQVAIDSAKRQFDLDLTNEIKRIKADMDIKKHGYPVFWTIINNSFNKNNINYNLTCPMNYLYNLKIKEFHSKESTLPMEYFFKKYNTDVNMRTCKKVERLIEKYSFNLFLHNIHDDNSASNDYILLRSDFEQMVQEILKTSISKNYLGLFSWLIDRAFVLTPNIKVNSAKLKTTLNKNKSLFMKVLYCVNKQNLLKCFSKNIKKSV